MYRVVHGTIYFYPRSPCGERLRQRLIQFGKLRFLSTLSLRRATAIYPSSTPPKKYFYPRSPCGERREESGQQRSPRNFYPRSPCGERQWTPLNSPVLCYFYPRSPCGERRHRAVNIQSPTAFLSTLSLRRATPSIQIQHLPKSISIHALLAESDTFAYVS